MFAEKVPLHSMKMTRENRRSLGTGRGGEGEEVEQEHERLVESPEPTHTSDKKATKMDNNYLHHPGNGYYVRATEGPKKVYIDRPVLSQSDILPQYSLKSCDKLLEDDRCLGGCCPQPKCDDAVKALQRSIPILSWLPKYEWREVSYDIIAGFIIAVMNIPQGMAYALLGNLPPIAGIYMAFFPVIVYAILGTSRHVSMGTFAVICLMSGKAAMDYRNKYDSSTAPTHSMMEITTAIAFAVGVVQAIMGVLRLGALSLLLNAELVSGFTTGAAVHVFTSQVKSLLGLKLERRVGIFKIIMTYIDIGSNLGSSNLAAVIISAITIIILVIYNEILKGLWTKRIRIPLPVELIIVAVGTLVSLFWDLHSTYSIDIVDHIPTGLPLPTVPNFDIVAKVFLPDGLVIAIVAYAISVSMAKIFASKHSYTVDANQELIAQGGSNVVGSFFSCGPIAASLSRSLIQEQIGGRTQLASLFSCSLLLIVLLWIGPCFETLPNCVLSSIIVVALKGMFLQVADLKKAWGVSKLNAFVWVATFLSTVVLDIEYGLAVGFGLSVVTLLWRSSRTSLIVLGAYGDTEVYVDINRSNQVQEITGMKILKCTGNLNFATAEHFTRDFMQIIRIDSTKKQPQQKASPPKQAVSTISREMIADDASIHNGDIHVGIERKIDYIILDMSNISSVDPEAALALNGVFEKCLKEDIKVMLASCTCPVLSDLRTCGVVQQVGAHNIYPTVHDAVVSSGSSFLHKKLPVSETSSQYGYGDSDSEAEHHRYQELESSVKQHNLDVPNP